MSSECQRTVEITVPAAEVEQETERVLSSLMARVKLPGFRPGKAPAGMVRSRFAGDIREEVVRNLVPKHFHKHAEDHNLRVVGTPDVTDIHYHAGEPLTFKAEFEVAPEFELGDYRGLTVPYREPEVTAEEVAKRLEELRERKAEFVNEPPRAVADGDYAVVSLEAQGEVEEALRKRDELVVEIGGADTLEAFSANLRGMSPGEEKEFDVTYPEDYGDNKLSGRTIHFRSALQGIRRKELPELNDAFAADLGDFKNLDELAEEIRKGLQREQEYLAQQRAKAKLVDELVSRHEFPVPEALVDRQIQNQVEQYLRGLAAQGADLDSVKLDWGKIRESRRDRAIKEVKASLLLERIADKEALGVTHEEVDREVQRVARQGREPVSAVRRRLEEDGGLNRIANRIRTDKTLSLLFEHARKTAGD
ncbi:MAG TPA: trigger factor [Bryobacteraceae bacterium]|nr:trigger factor [Bryobacteraceae bacterium]